MSLSKSKSSSSFQKPSYQWEGFGRKSTKPPWYDPYKLDPGRRPVQIWEGETCGFPRVQNKEATGRAPFVHEHLNSQKELPNQRIKTGQNVMRGEDKPKPAHAQSSFYSRKQMEANRQAANTSELQKTLYGKSKPIEKPILYPANVNHDMALVLEKKVGPRPAWDKRVERIETAFQWNQTQYMPFSRTRSDFKHLPQYKQPVQPP